MSLRQVAFREDDKDVARDEDHLFIRMMNRGTSACRLQRYKSSCLFLALLASNASINRSEAFSISSNVRNKKKSSKNSGGRKIKVGPSTSYSSNKKKANKIQDADVFLQKENHVNKPGVFGEVDEVTPTSVSHPAATPGRRPNSALEVVHNFAQQEQQQEEEQRQSSKAGALLATTESQRAGQKNRGGPITNLLEDSCCGGGDEVATRADESSEHVIQFDRTGTNMHCKYVWVCWKIVLHDVKE
ncbi:unnamed protein product [Amoebophrya sp. A120]|nr:unnamed protein product [Amoebophrya sp. A120]|eukprot:GSA120T00013846001.1